MQWRYSGRVMFGLMLGLAVLLLSSAAPVYAADPNTPTAIADSQICTEAGLTHRLAVCVRNSIKSGAVEYFLQFEPYLHATIVTVITLALLLYGVKMSFGAVEKIGRDTMILILKVGCVFAFISNGQMMLDYITTGMDAAGAAVVNYAPGSGVADDAGTQWANAPCYENMVTQKALAVVGMGATTPWLGVDCILDTVLGIKTTDINQTGSQVIAWNKKLDNPDPTKDNVNVSRGLLNFLFSSMQTSILGGLITIVGAFYILGLLMFIIRAFFTYIGGYMGITFLIIVAPIFIPMVLFKATDQYFEKWTKLLISFALQPIITLFFLVFALAAVDLATFSGTYSIMYRIAGKASQQPNFDLNAYLETNNIIVTKDQLIANVKGDYGPNVVPTGQEDIGGKARKLLMDQCAQKAQDDDKTGGVKEMCASFYPIKIPKHVINWDKLALTRDPQAGGAKPGQTICQEVTASVLFACMVVFVLNSLMAVVPMVATELLGNLGQTPNIADSIGAPSMSKVIKSVKPGGGG